MIPEIQFSRHAKRRMKLYGIGEEIVVSIIKGYLQEAANVDGRYEVTGKESYRKYGYKIKVIFSQEKEKLTVITAYPLKRGRKNENILR